MMDVFGSGSNYVAKGKFRLTIMLRWTIKVCQLFINKFKFSESHNKPVRFTSAFRSFSVAVPTPAYAGTSGECLCLLLYDVIRGSFM